MQTYYKYILSLTDTNTYCMVLICAFLKLLITVPLRNKAAPTVAKAIFEIFLRYGYLKYLSCILDNGFDMINAWTKSLYEIMSVKCIRISPYKPSSDGQVERTNRQILSILRKFTIDDPKKFFYVEEYTIHTILLNSWCRDDKCFDMVLPQPNECLTKTNKQAISHWSQSIERIRKYVRENIIDAKQKQKKYYDVHTRKHSFEVGDLCYIKIHHWPLNSDTKLKPIYKGIYKITKFISDTNVIVEDEGGKTLPRSIYKNFLKRYVPRRDIANPHRKINRTARKPKSSELESVDSTESSEDGIESSSDENKSTSDENESSEIDIDHEDKGVINEDYSRMR